MRLHTTSTDGPPGRTLLVVHGGPDWDHTYLREPLVRLAGQHRVLLPDLRGCGRSPKAPGYTPDEAVADLLELLDSRAVHRADVLGFSWGGLLAQRLAVSAPARVRRLIIASSSILPVPPGTGFRAGPPAAPAPPGFHPGPELVVDGPALTRSMAYAQAAEHVWRRSALPGYLDRLAEVRFTAEWLGALRAGTLPSARVPDAAAKLTALGLPILLLHGRRDTVFPAESATTAARLIPNARAILLNEAGHMAHVDRPAAWLAAVRGFLHRAE